MQICIMSFRSSLATTVDRRSSKEISSACFLGQGQGDGNSMLPNYANAQVTAQTKSSSLDWTVVGPRETQESFTGGQQSTHTATQVDLGEK